MAEIPADPIELMWQTYEKESRCWGCGWFAGEWQIWRQDNPVIAEASGAHVIAAFDLPNPEEFERRCGRACIRAAILALAEMEPTEGMHTAAWNASFGDPMPKIAEISTKISRAYLRAAAGVKE